jgi:hypothetical protein
MKILKTTAIGACFIVCTLHSSAQSNTIPLNEPDYNKPKLFADLPQKMTLRMSELESLFNLPVGAAVNTLFTEKFRFQGTVVSKSDAQDPTVKSIVLRSSNRQGATFTFTRRTNSDGSSTYLGRMISMQHGDAYELTIENGTYVLNKTGYYDLVSE